MAIIVFLIHIKLYYMAVSCPHHQDQPCQVSEVLESRNPNFPPGSHVVAYTGWRELAVVHHQHRNYYHHYHHHLQYHDTFAILKITIIIIMINCRLTLMPSMTPMAKVHIDENCHYHHYSKNVPQPC